MGASWRIGFDPECDRCELVRRGPYRALKHPVYWSLVALALSQMLLIGLDMRTWVLLAGTVAYCVVQSRAEDRYWNVRRRGRQG